MLRGTGMDSSDLYTVKFSRMGPNVTTNAADPCLLVEFEQVSGEKFTDLKALKTFEFLEAEARKAASRQDISMKPCRCCKYRRVLIG
jgi:hypothetical protein